MIRLVTITILLLTTISNTYSQNMGIGVNFGTANVFEWDVNFQTHTGFIFGVGFGGSPGPQSGSKSVGELYTSIN